MNSLYQLKNYMISTTKNSDLLDFYIDDINKIIDSFLGTSPESNLKLLQAAIFAIYDVHNRLYNKNLPSMLPVHFYKNINALTLYNQLIGDNINNVDGSVLKKICEHMLGNKAKQIVSSYTSFQIPFSDAAKKLIDKIIQKDNEYNIARINRNDVQIILHNLVNDLSTYKFQDKKNLFLFFKQMKIYLDLPIIDKEDIEYFLSELSIIIISLHVDFKLCMKSLNFIFNSKNNFLNDSINAIRLDLNKISTIGNNLKSLIKNIAPLINANEENSSLIFDCWLDIRDNGKNKYVINLK